MLYNDIGVGLSALLVSTIRAMRRPLHCGTSDRLAPRFLCICPSIGNPKIGQEPAGNLKKIIMNCFYHDDKPAIVSCAKCGVGLCKDCMTNAAYTYDGKPLCLNCSKPIALDELKEAQNCRTWSLVKFIFSGFFLGIGAIGLAGGADIMQVWIIAGVAGIPTAFKASRRSREQRIMDEIHDRYENDIINLLFGWVMRLLIKLVFIIGLAPICAVYTCLSNLIKFVKSKRQINEAKEALEYIEQCLNGEQDSVIGPDLQTTNQDSAYAPALSEIPIQHGNPNQVPTNGIYTQPAQVFPDQTTVPPYQMPTPTKRKNAPIIGIGIGSLALIGIIIGYFMWYIPYAKDRDALRSYVIANNVFLRSSKVAGVEYNILSKIPYGSELITYSKDMEWAEVKVNGTKGFVASPYLLEWNDFKLLNDVWGSTDTKEYIESSKCRLAILDYCKRNQFNTGNENWQLYTLQKNVKPNNVLFPRLNNGYDKFTEFAFILKNNATQERRFAIYSFDEETEKPIFLYDENAPEDGQIKQIKYNGGKYTISYTGHTSVISNKTDDYKKNGKIKFTALAPNSAAIGDQIRLTYTITTSNAKDFRAPQIKDFEILAGPLYSTQQSTDIVKGQKDKSITYTYILQANKEGTFIISPATIIANEKTITSNSVQIKVLPTKPTAQFTPPTKPKYRKEENTADNNIYETVEQQPEFPGGITGLMNFISNNLKYPINSQEAGIQGKVIVSFVVNKDGSTSDFRIVRSVDEYLDKEALRVLSSMPKWKPGRQKGVPVRVKYTIPINFKLS